MAVPELAYGTTWKKILWTMYICICICICICPIFNIEYPIEQSQKRHKIKTPLKKQSSHQNINMFRSLPSSLETVDRAVHLRGGGYVRRVRSFTPTRRNLCISIHVM
jgi:hypothetical protein